MAHTEEKTNLAAFDFDGTLIDAHCCTRFLLRYFGLFRYSRALIAASAAELFRIRQRDAIKLGLLHRLLRGVDAERFDAMGRDFSEWILERIDARALAAVRKHQAAEHAVIIVSASLAVYIDYVAAALDLHTVYAMRMQARKQQLTGFVDGGVNMTQNNKVTAIRSWIADSGLDRSSVQIWAYGDSSGDFAMLAYADRPFLVSLHQNEWLTEFVK